MSMTLRFASIIKVPGNGTLGTLQICTQATSLRAIEIAKKEQGQIINNRTLYSDLRKPIKTQEDVIRLFIALQDPEYLASEKAKIQSIDNGDLFVLTGSDKRDDG